MSGRAFAVGLARLNALCERAKQYYLARIPDGDDPVRAQLVHYTLPRCDHRDRPDAEGWVSISTLIDRTTGKGWHIWWHQETDKLKLVPEGRRGPAA